MSWKYGIMLRKGEKEVDVRKVTNIFRFKGFTTTLEISFLVILFKILRVKKILQTLRHEKQITNKGTKSKLNLEFFSAIQNARRQQLNI